MAPGSKHSSHSSPSCPWFSSGLSPAAPSELLLTLPSLPDLGMGTSLAHPGPPPFSQAKPILSHSQRCPLCWGPQAYVRRPDMLSELQPSGLRCLCLEDTSIPHSTSHKQKSSLFPMSPSPLPLSSPTHRLEPQPWSRLPLWSLPLPQCLDPPSKYIISSGMLATAPPLALIQSHCDEKKTQIPHGGLPPPYSLCPSHPVASLSSLSS